MRQPLCGRKMGPLNKNLQTQGEKMVATFAGF
jgi:hypothetical protein